MKWANSLTVPPNTPQGRPVTAIIRPTVLYLKELTVDVPPGTLGSVFYRVYDYGLQILPLFGWLNDSISVAYDRRLTDQPRIILEAYSTAEDWQHTLQFSAILENR